MKKFEFFIGAHGVGKTTIANQRLENLRNTGIKARLIAEVARECPYPIFSGNQKTSIEAQKWMVEQQLDKEKAALADASSSVVILDRSLVDVYAYTLAGGFLVYADKVRRRACKQMAYLKKYAEIEITHVLIPNHPLVDDGVRSTDANLQERIQRIIADFLVKEGWTHVTLKLS
jgi:nicotinamide riboside kinase